VAFTERLYSALALDSYRARRLPGSALASFALIALALSSWGVRGGLTHGVTADPGNRACAFALGAPSATSGRVSCCMETSWHLAHCVGGIKRMHPGDGLAHLSGDKWDFGLFGVAVVVLFVTTLLASYRPGSARDAHNPVEALRAER